MGTYATLSPMKTEHVESLPIVTKVTNKPDTSGWGWLL